MKRRDFIINSTVALSGITFFTACNKKDISEQKNTDNIAENTTTSENEINCIYCKSCLSVCPKSINIPEIFYAYNQYKHTNDKASFKKDYETISENERADKCIRCYVCNTKCPKSLDIPNLLEKIDEEYRKI